MTASFDTLAVARRLQEADFTDRQAEALTGAIGTALTGGVATKADIADLRSEMAEMKADLRSEMGEMKAELRGEMAELRGEMDARFARVEADLVWIKRIGGVIVALLAVPLLRDLITALSGVPAP